MDQCAEVPSAEVKVNEQNSMDTSENDSTAEHSEPNNLETAEVATPETKEIPEKKGRGSGRKRKSDADMMAEAKATCGHEIDPSQGRQLRKRPDPPKVEKKTPARKPYTQKSKTPSKEDEKETMVENDVKENVDGVKDDDDSNAETAAEKPTNGDEAHEAADETNKVADEVHEAVDKVTDNGESSPVEEAAPTDAAPSAPATEPAEPTAQEPEKPAEDENEEKVEEPERSTPAESTDNNSTNNSV